MKGVFAPIDIDREGTLRSIERLSATTHLVSAAEYLARRREFEPGSLGDWEIVHERYAHLRPWQRRILAAASRPQVAKALHAGRILASVTLLAPSGPKLRALANGYLVATAAALYPRGNYGSDGSDQVSFQASAATFVARAVPTPGAQDAAIWYVGIQSALAYAISGWVKLFGASWRTGRAVPGVMRTRSYGNKHLWAFFKDRPRLAAVSAHGMLAFEALFPLVFAAKGHLTRPFIAAAIGFHATIAGSMGLGRFFTAFGSMLPAIAYTTNTREKSKLVPAITAASITSTLIGGAIAAATRRRRVRRQRLDIHTINCSSGNTLHYQWKRSPRPSAVLILEHGMLATPQHFAWIINELPEGTDVITYWRAGYGPSVNAAGGYSTDDSAEDLTDLIDSLPDTTSQVFVGGHSLGGLVARRAAQISTRAIAGVIYLDSSHPGQLVISTGQRKGADGLSSALALIPSSLGIGLGWLLPKPHWVHALPKQARQDCLDQYRDSRLWRAGTLEWKDARRRFSRRHTAPLETIDLPALVVTAEQTLRADTAQDFLHGDLASSHNGKANRVVILGADHDSILTNQAHAASTSQAIAAFITETQAAR
ncbi:alpha/beta fold hydrolase [Leifsonia sp. McL0607]|uniref:alpha/beta fold hydrolase n=1 Tax=Leifsonia sp. McL0607 TaxID=3415672 RepID=UPI003CE9205D